MAALPITLSSSSSDEDDNYQFTPQYHMFLDEINKSNFTWSTSGDIVIVANLLGQTQGQDMSGYEIISHILSKYIYIDEYENVFKDALIHAGYVNR